MTDGGGFALRWRPRLLFWGTLAFTLVRALWPDPFTEDTVGRWDKVVHALAFYVLSLLAAMAFSRRPLLAVAGALLAFGGLIEVLQAIPALHRDSSWGDLIADVTGITLALTPIALMRFNDPRR
jgi:VanZ family protein